jgi:hypothetical protein
MRDEHKDVQIAAYLFEDLAKQDFDAVPKLAEHKTITIEGVVLVQKDADGDIHVAKTGDHLGRKGAKIGGGVGLGRRDRRLRHRRRRRRRPGARECSQESIAQIDGTSAKELKTGLAKAQAGMGG